MPLSQRRGLPSVHGREGKPNLGLRQPLQNYQTILDQTITGRRHRCLRGLALPDNRSHRLTEYKLRLEKRSLPPKKLMSPIPKTSSMSLLVM